MKLIAFVVAVITAWLTWGATSLHQKNPAEYGLTLPLVLGAITVLALAVTFSGKAKAKAKAK
ncbi:hypothetical protein ACWEOG_03740 [Amycolatopsis japonica]|uniref:hypothetical protein n=2 Tax=Amycolatopsis TaxID=1813 RepID=UPI00366D414A